MPDEKKPGGGMTVREAGRKGGQKVRDERGHSFYEEIGFFPPVKYFPGVIGGHCVMPNIELLKRFTDSEILEAIEHSNRKKKERDTRTGRK